jgi:hypothetical protein
MLEELEALYRERLHEYTRLATALAGDEESGRDAVRDAFAKAVRNRRRSDPLMDAYLERVGHTLVAKRTVVLAMTVHHSALRAAAALAVCAASLLVAGCGSSGKSAKVLGGSNNTSVCLFTKRFGKGRVYAEIAVSPVSLKATACSAFNRSFGGRSLGRNPPSLPPGTGRPHCDFNKIGSSYRIELGVFASPHTGTGRAFCRSFHPGHGFKRVSLR